MEVEMQGQEHIVLKGLFDRYRIERERIRSG